MALNHPPKHTNVTIKTPPLLIQQINHLVSISQRVGTCPNLGLVLGDMKKRLASPLGRVTRPNSR